MVRVGWAWLLPGDLELVTIHLSQGGRGEGGGGRGGERRGENCVNISNNNFAKYLFTCAMNGTDV